MVTTAYSGNSDKAPQLRSPPSAPPARRNHMRLRMILPVVLAAATAFGSAAFADTTASSLDQQAAPLLNRPALVNPLTVTITPTVPVVILNNARDYVVTVAAGAVFNREVAISGGHNV